MLSKLDAKEDGSRELSGEWVVGKALWQKLLAEWTTAREAQEGSDLSKPPKQMGQMGQVILYLHGGITLIYLIVISHEYLSFLSGAYYLSSAAATRLITIPLSKYANARVFG
jgi:hypothetical protein